MDKIEKIKYAAAIATGSYFFGPTVFEYLFTKQNLDLFTYSFLSSSGVLASTTALFALTVGNPVEFLGRFLTTKETDEHSLEVTFDSYEPLDLDYDFRQGMYFLKLNYNDHHSSLYLLNVTGNEPSSPTIHIKRLSGKDELLIELDSNRKLTITPKEFVYGTLKITRL
jgi:hypothetical protein